MNLYKCRRCKGTWAMERTVEKFWCPMCGNYETDMSPYLTPDPQADGSSTTLTVDDIVRLADRELENHSLEGSRRALKPVFRLVAAKIEGVRKNHQEQIDKLGLEIESSDACFRREADSNLNGAIKALERKVESLRLNQNELIAESVNRNFTVKPQPKGGVALDKEGMPHDLIPGRSVIQGPCVEMLFLRKTARGNLVGYTSDRDSARDKDGTWESEACQCTWLFDLPKAQDVGGDK